MVGISFTVLSLEKRSKNCQKGAFSEFSYFLRFGTFSYNQLKLVGNHLAGQTHLKIHSKDEAGDHEKKKDYECKLCDKFRLKEAHKKVSVKCEYCPRVFSLLEIP